MTTYSNMKRVPEQSALQASASEYFILLEAMSATVSGLKQALIQAVGSKKVLFVIALDDLYSSLISASENSVNLYQVGKNGDDEQSKESC